MWHTETMVAFDLETTGVDVEQDRIVTAAVILICGRDVTRYEWLADPGIDIPAEAAAIHGITTEHARAEGKPAAEVVEQIAERLSVYARQGCALVGHNVPFDLTLLDRECRRHGVVPFVDRVADRPPYVIDTRVLDTHCLPYRKRPSDEQGPRQLVTLAQVYELPWQESAAHGCAYDALMSARIAYRIGTLAHMRPADWPQSIRFNRRPRFYALKGLDLAQLHELQVTLAAEQAAGLEKHFRKTDPNAVVDGSWPMRPWGESCESD